MVNPAAANAPASRNFLLEIFDDIILFLLNVFVFIQAISFNEGLQLATEP